VDPPLHFPLEDLDLALVDPPPSFPLEVRDQAQA